MTILFSLFLLSFTAIANVEPGCQKQAEDLLTRAVLAGKLPEIQPQNFQRVLIQSFQNTTPGSYYQEYEAEFNVVLKGNGGARKSYDGFASFYSPFICENLRIQSIRLE